ncbi:MAG: xanthine dehydrogenase family protein molybdopterin-binding subunit [Planctomycetota bacterium]|nr:xanthine dehydrogenase family protein molybdopterin-binding subunit [Planctomycetota bacterium]
MPRTVTYKVGLVGHDKYKQGVEGIEQDLTVEIHELDAQPWGRDDVFRHVGHDVPRVDGPVKATGAAKYTYDINRPDLCVAGLVVSPHAHANIVSVDASAAKAMPGVLAVKTYEGRRVTYAGGIAAAVCAESESVLGDALNAIQVVYDVKPGPAVTDDAMKDGAPVVDPRRKTNVAGPRRGPLVRGKPDEAIAGADVVVEATYRTPVQTHSCLEPHGCMCEIHDDGTATVWASTQATAFFANRRLTQALGLPRNKVRVLTHHMGGGFGSKFSALEWDVICAEFARETKRPVRLMLSRRVEHLVGGNRPDSIQRMRLAGSKDGTFAALDGETWGTSGNGTGGAGSANFMVYELPNLSMVQNGVATFSGIGRAFRAPRHPQGFYALESVIDRYAYAAGVDALAVRMKNDRHPVRQVQWRIGAERIGWRKNRRQVPGSDKGPVKRGVGCASGRWGQGGRHMVGRSQLVFDVVVDKDGGIAFQNAVQDIGTGTRTLIAVIAAEELGLAPGDIDVRIGDTNFPPGPGSGGSTTAPSIGAAVRNGALRVKESLAGLLALEWGVDEGALRWKDGVCRGPDGKQATVREACALLGEDGLRVRGRRERNWRSPYRETAGCQFAQVAVDTETGFITVEKVVAVHDCGRVIDSLTARSQVNGGVIQGISYALYEEKHTDRNLGDMVNPTFDTYRILGMEDCPPIDVVLTSVVAGYSNTGMAGLGEPATVPTPGAIANAVYNAIGVQVTDLPMTPARVLEALERRQG